MDRSPVDLEVGHLRTLVEVADRGSIAAVARARGCTPSAVSQQLAALEDRAGVTLLDRANTGVTLLPPGARLVQQARDILVSLDRAALDLADVATDGIPHGRVRVGAVASAAATVVSDAVTATEAAHADVTAVVADREPASSLDAVRLGDLDVAVVDAYEHVLGEPMAWAASHDLLAEPLVVVLPPGEQVTDAPVRLADLADRRWVAADEGAACGEAVRRACHGAGFVPEVAWVTDDLHLSVSHVAAGHGVALLPLLVVHDRLDEVQVRPTAHATMTRRLLAVTRHRPPPPNATRAILDALRDAGTAWQQRVDALAADLAPGSRGRPGRPQRAGRRR